MLDSVNDDSIDKLIDKAYRAYTSTKGTQGSQIRVYEEACDDQFSYV